MKNYVVVASRTKGPSLEFQAFQNPLFKNFKIPEAQLNGVLILQVVKSEIYALVTERLLAVVCPSEIFRVVVILYLVSADIEKIKLRHTAY